MASPLSVWFVDPDRRSWPSVAGWMRWNIAATLFRSAEEIWQEMAGSFQSPSCIVTEVALPGASGLALLASLTRGRAHTPVIFSSAQDDPDIVVQALKAGAVDYLQKPVDLAEITSRIEHAADRYERWRAEQARLRQIAVALNELCPRERQFLTGLISGMTSSEIASEMQVGLPTVSKQRAQMLKRLGARNVVELTAKILEFSILELPPWLRHGESSCFPSSVMAARYITTTVATD